MLLFVLPLTILRVTNGMKPALGTPAGAVPRLGTECSMCEDIGATYQNMYPCNLGDPGGVSPTECGFHCGMFCKPEEEDCSRRRSCENALKKVTTDENVMKYFWETGTCSEFTPYDQCVFAPKEVIEALGGLQCFDAENSGQFDHDTLLVDHPECQDDPNCKAVQPNAGPGGQSVSDQCLICYWVAKAVPLFQAACRPKNVRTDCHEIVREYKEGSPGKGLRRRRLHMANKKSDLNEPDGAVFSKTEVAGIGSPDLNVASKIFSPTLENCMAKWNVISTSRIAQNMLQCLEPPMKQGLGEQTIDPSGKSVTEQCKCMCMCPYTEMEWMSLSSTCKFQPDQCDLPHLDTLYLSDPLQNTCLKKREPKMSVSALLKSQEDAGN
jgi:hypothetical protein